MKKMLKPDLQLLLQSKGQPTAHLKADMVDRLVHLHALELQGTAGGGSHSHDGDGGPGRGLSIKKIMKKIF